MEDLSFHALLPEAKLENDMENEEEEDDDEGIAYFVEERDGGDCDFKVTRRSKQASFEKLSVSRKRDATKLTHEIEGFAEIDSERVIERATRTNDAWLWAKMSGDNRVFAIAEGKEATLLDAHAHVAHIVNKYMIDSK